MLVQSDKKISTYTRRFIERRNRRALMKKCEDFTIRQHGMPIVRVVMYFITILLFSIWLLNDYINSLLTLPPGEPAPIESAINVLAVVTFAAFTAGVVAIVILYQLRENIVATEFQNLIFASGMRVNSDFCLIVHKEKSGFYCDYNFTQLFADFGEHHHDPFHQLMASEGFKQSDEDLLVRALENGESASFTFTLKKKNKPQAKMKVSLSPLERPRGFFIIQGSYV